MAATRLRTLSGTRLVSVLGCHADREPPLKKWSPLLLLFLHLSILLVFMLVVHRNYHVHPCYRADPELQLKLQEILDSQNPRQEPHYALRDAWSYLSQATYEKLSVEERLALAETIANFEAESQLGIPPVQLRAVQMDEETLGYYTNTTKTISISIVVLQQDNPRVLVETIAHECWHAYQSYLIENLDFSLPIVQNTPYFDELRDWKLNFSNYRSTSDGHTSVEQYYLQPVEISAYRYQWQEADQIFMHVEDVEIKQFTKEGDSR